ncbi:MAG: L,D-transpeptidase family protein [Myxococcota bacterium]
MKIAASALSKLAMAVLLLAMAVLLSVGCHSSALTPKPDGAGEVTSPIDDEITQLIAVTIDQWGDFQGTLRRYERAPEGAWFEVAEPIAVVIGREGYGWGRGLHGAGAPAGRPGPVKREGDGRSPAGAFSIGDAYGYEADADGVSLLYTRASAELRCVDDPRSRHYNQIVSTREVSPDWRSAEHMRREDDLYELTIVVGHNTNDRIAGDGSCIFLHAWIDGNTGMSGCTAMPREDVEALATWLEPDSAVLVALPEREYEALKGAWLLP